MTRSFSTALAIGKSGFRGGCSSRLRSRVRAATSSPETRIRTVPVPSASSWAGVRAAEPRPPPPRAAGQDGRSSSVTASLERDRSEAFGKPCFEPACASRPHVAELSETRHCLGGSFFTHERTARRGSWSCINSQTHPSVRGMDTEACPCPSPAQVSF